MELKRIKEIMAAMKRSRTRRLRIKEKDFEIELEMADMDPPRVMAAPQQEYYAQPKPAGAGKGADIPTSLNPIIGTAEAEEQPVAGEFVLSPMVGTYYSTPAPEEPSFVKVGEKVDKDTVVCIIEAMKVMNEVKAGVSGTVKEVLVENGHPVEFGTKLVLIV